MFDNGDEAVRSLEMRFLFDRAFAASQSGRPDMADLFVRAAERLLSLSSPAIAQDVSLISSRKGTGQTVATSLINRVNPTQAAAVATIWTLRGARRPAIDALSEAFRDDPEFVATVKMLCWRAFEPIAATEATKVVPIGPAASYRR